MKKYLVRGGADPCSIYKPKDIISRNYIGGNSGNMMFLYSVINALTTDNSCCTITKRKNNWSADEIERINAEYDAVILPMADAFRMDYISSLRNYTDFVRKLKIPCIVAGVGLRDEYEPRLDMHRPFDDDVKAFIREILNHSALVGLRGEITARYLERLGFIGGRDFTVIGCPSLYMHGLAIDRKEPRFDIIGVNLNAIALNTINAFYINLLNTDSNIHIVQQRKVEFVDWYYGQHSDLKTFVPEFPEYDIFSEFDFTKMKKEGRVHFFLDIPSWLEYTGHFGAFAGSRFHGTVAAILSGVPAAITPIDSRTRELAEFHNIPQIKKQDLIDKKSLEECFEHMDFSDFHTSHTNNFNNYVSFLFTNGLTSVFENSTSLPFGSSPLEKRILKDGIPVTYEGYETCNLFEKTRRKAEYEALQIKAKLRSF